MDCSDSVFNPYIGPMTWLVDSNILFIYGSDVVAILHFVCRLAQRIIRGDVPEPLMNRKVRFQVT